MKAEYMSIGGEGLRLTEKWLSTYASIRAVGVMEDATNGRTPDLNLGEVNHLVTSALASISTLHGATQASLGLLGGRLPGIKNSLDALDAQLSVVNANIEPMQGSTCTDQNGNLQLLIQHPEKGGIKFDLGTPLASVVQQANALLENVPHIAHAVGQKAIDVFAGTVVSAVEHLAAIKGNSEKCVAELNVIQGAREQVQSLVSITTQHNQAIEETLATVVALKTNADVNSSEIEQKLARIREISKDADSLQIRVEGFAAQFEAFETQMKARLEQFDKFEQATKDSFALNEQHDLQIKALIDKADTMIRGATTAGLSQSLDETKKLYEARLDTTQKYFLMAVGALLICSLPIAAQIIPGPWQQYFPAQAHVSASDASPWLGVIGKLMLMLPATWATAFFASNYAELFHLSREYAHKAALAKAVDGFKREAPNYEQEIVGSVFMEIQDNPGSRKAPPPATPQNPITEKFLKRVLEAIKLVRGKE